MLEHIAGYLQLGMYVLPICWPDDHGLCACGRGHTGRAVGKAPLLLHGHLDASADPIQVSRWWNLWPNANVAVALWPSGLLVLDLDSDEAIAEAHRLGLPGDEPVVATGGGGKQHYFRRPDGVGPVRRTKRGEARAMDVLTDGYTILPPSRHASGSTYRWLRPPAGLATLPDPPDWVVRLVFEKQYASFDDDPDLDAPPTDAEAKSVARTLKSVIGLLSKRAHDLMDNLVVTDDRSGQAWELARLLVERGVRDPRTLAVALYASGIHQSKWEDRRDRWTDCARVAKRALEGALADVEAAAADPLAGVIVPGEAWMQSASDVDWLWYPFIGRGLSTTLAGGVRRGKSTFLAGLLKVMTNLRSGPLGDGVIDLGPHYLGYPVKPLVGRALLISEEAQSVWRTRPDIDWAKLDVVTEFAMLTGSEAVWERFLAEVRSGHWQLVIVDSLDVLATARGAKSENEATDMIRVILPLLSACRVSNTALVMLDHAAKSRVDLADIDAVRGSTAKTGRADVIIVLAEPEEMKDTTKRVLAVRSRYPVADVPDSGLVVEWNAETGLYEAVCSYSEWKRRRRELVGVEKERELLNVLSDGPKGVKELIEKLGVSEKTVRNRLDALIKKGVVCERVAQGSRRKVYGLSLGEETSDSEGEEHEDEG